MNKALVIYHANCNDGFGAALAFWKYAESKYDSVVYHPGVYGAPPPEVDKDTAVFILDFSYKPEVMVDLAKNAGHLTVLDHHKTAAEAWEKYLYYPISVPMEEMQPSNMGVHFDMTRSGAMMALDYFSGDDTYNVLFDFLQDRDLWTFGNRDTKYFTPYLHSLPQTFAVWHLVAIRLNDVKQYEDIMKHGETLNRFFNKQCEDIIGATKQILSLNGHEGLVCNCTPQFASDVGNILAQQSGTFGATYYLASDDTFKWSLRSIGDYDVSALAKYWGGGGHKNAAGFKTTQEQMSLGLIITRIPDDN